MKDKSLLSENFLTATNESVVYLWQRSERNIYFNPVLFLYYYYLFLFFLSCHIMRTVRTTGESGLVSLGLLQNLKIALHFFVRACSL